MIIIKDIDKVQMFPQSCKDPAGRLRVGAAVVPATPLEDIDRLVEAGVDVLVIEALRGDSQFVRMSSSGYRESHPHNIDITEEAPNYTVANLTP